MGQLGPFGSGCFGLTIDPQMIETHATQAVGFNGIFDRDLNMEDTPVADEHDQAGNHNSMTPMLSHTPSIGSMYGGPGSEMVSAAQTPGMQSMHCGFSPALFMGANQNYGSPMMGSPSPYYGSP